MYVMTVYLCHFDSLPPPDMERKQKNNNYWNIILIIIVARENTNPPRNLHPKMSCILYADDAHIF